MGALALAAVGAYGALRPDGDDSWRDGTAVIIENETGARFVFREGILYPVVNYSSAVLILGSTEPRRAHVPRESLNGVPRGTPLGIPGAPDLLPAAGDLVATAWTLCSRPPSTRPGPTAEALPAAESVLLIGSAPPVARPLADRAVVASDPAGGLHLIWRNRRFAITDPDLVAAAFAWPRPEARAVDVAVLNSVPAGPDLGRIRIDRSGRPSVVEGFRTGEVFVVENQSGGRQFGVVLSGGLAEITPAQADLLIADGANGPGGRPREMGQAQYAAAPRAASLVPTGDILPPAVAPELVGRAEFGGLCATFSNGGGPGPEVSVAASAPSVAGEIRTTWAAAGLAASVDWVFVRPGSGAVVESLAGPTSPSGDLAFISDLGLRHAVPSRETLGILGFAGIRPQRMPSGLVALLPSGRALDPVAAALPAATPPV